MLKSFSFEISKSTLTSIGAIPVVAHYCIFTVIDLEFDLIEDNLKVMSYGVSVITLTYYNDVIMGAISSQITSPTIVYSIVYPDADQRKHQSWVSLAFVRGIHRGPGNSPHKWPVTRKFFPFDDVIMVQTIQYI